MSEMYFCAPEKAMYSIFCEGCGNTSIVGKDHRLYCPVCGRDVVSNIVVTPIKATHNRDANVANAAHNVEITFEMKYRCTKQLTVDNEKYSNLIQGDFEDDLVQNLVKEAVLNGVCNTDFALYDYDLKKQLVDWEQES